MTEELEQTIRDLNKAINKADTGGPESDKQLAIATGKAVLAILYVLLDNRFTV